jgi:polyhydroxyalkanoate synthase
MLDEFSLPGQLFEDVLELLYREDVFNCGGLRISGEVTGVERLRCPVLAVLNPLGRVVPPTWIAVALAKLPPVQSHTLTYEGEKGVALQHLGPLIGPSGHQSLWPRILDWASLARYRSDPTDATVSKSGSRSHSRARPLSALELDTVIRDVAKNQPWRRFNSSRQERRIQLWTY